MIGIALPLFIVTMASPEHSRHRGAERQWLPPRPRPAIHHHRRVQPASAPVRRPCGQPGRITAALCAGEDAHPDRARRYWAAVVAGVTYVLFGLGAGAATAFISASPPILIEAVAGLALIGAFGSALMGAVSAAQDREAAVLTFLVTGSGLTFFGISGAFWGLLAGGAMMALTVEERAALSGQRAALH